MSKKLHFALLLFLTLITVNQGFSQSDLNKTPLERVIYDENVKEPLSYSELQKINEVYGDQAQEAILNNPQRLKDVKNILRNRVEIYQDIDKDLSSLQDLSEIPLFKDYQQNLTRDFNIDTKSFNPLKYQFNFYSRNSSIYKIGNTGYYIVIKSQFQLQ